MSIDFNLSGALYVTGGGSGIGRQVCLKGAASGAVIGVIDRDLAAAETVAAEVRALDGQSAAAVADVADMASLQAAVAHLREQIGPATYMVAAAGISRTAHALEMSDQQWSDVLAVNLTGVFNAARAVAPAMLEVRRGSIVAVSSISGTGGHPARANYTASKAGLVSLAKTLAIEWGRHGVRVNTVLPGPVDTPLLRGSIPPEYIDSVMIDRIPMARLSAAEEQAQPILFLLSDAASFVNGAVLTVDGGLTAGPFTAESGADLGSRNL